MALLHRSGRGSPRRRVAALVLWAVFATAVAAIAQGDAPANYQMSGQRQVGSGVWIAQYVRQGAPVVVHVARMERSADVALRVVTSGDQIGGPDGTLERTSAMCQRVQCLVAINGDFALPESGLPVGGVVSHGQMLRSPVADHHQLSITEDGNLFAGSMQWSAQLMPSDLHPLAIDGVNGERQSDRLVLYTPQFAATTGTNEFGSELVVRVRQPQGTLRVGQTALVELESFADNAGNTAIPADGAVLSGHGRAADALRDLWGRVQSGVADHNALLRMETNPPAAESTGGTPVLVHEGRRWVGNDGSDFVASPHPRTVVGWNDHGEVLLVTADGRQPGYSVGLTLAEAADLMISLGATEAINLDGGGSTSFVTEGNVINRPSDRLVRRQGKEQIVKLPSSTDRVIGPVERPVTTALAIVATRPPPHPHVDPLAGQPLGSVRELALPAPRGDSASDPRGSLPALIAAPGGSNIHAILILVAVMLLTMAAGGLGAASTQLRPALLLARRRSRPPEDVATPD